MAEATRSGLRSEAIAADIPGPSGDEIAKRVVASGSGMPILALTRKQFAVLEALVSASAGVVSAEELLKRAWDEHADPFTNAVRIAVSSLRKRLGEPSIIATVPGAGYRIDIRPDSKQEGGDRG
jgi:DNA-binding response OmpR family regulator